MYKKPLVSVVIPFFNSAKFMVETIESVCNQFYENWEILLCDDGSTDNSVEIVSGYIERYPDKIRYFKHDGNANKGAGQTRNLGIRQAKGKYIALLDADDIWVPEKLDQQVEIMELLPNTGMVYGITKLWYSWEENHHKSDRYSSLVYKPDVLILPPNLLVDRLLKYQEFFISMSNVMLRREVVEKLGGFEENFRGMFEDEVFLAKMLLDTPVFVSSLCWDYYRQHSNSKMGKIKKNRVKKLSEDLAYANWLKEYLAANKIDNPGILNALDYFGGAIERNIELNNRMFLGVHTRYYRLKRKIKDLIMTTADYCLPKSMISELQIKLKGPDYYPRIGWASFGDLRRLNPVSDSGYRDSLLALDNHYINNFLTLHSGLIKGKVLVLGDTYCVGSFKHNAITDLQTLNFLETIDLLKAPEADSSSNQHRGPLEDVPPDSLNCIVFTKTSQYITDIPYGIKKLYQILKPGGALLTTFQAVRRSSNAPRDRYLQSIFARRYIEQLFNQVFKSDNVEIQGYGNILVTISLLHGITSDELKPEELEYHDPNHEILYSVKALKT